MSAQTVWICDGCGKEHKSDPRYPSLAPDSLPYTFETNHKRLARRSGHACSDTCLAKALFALANELQPEQVGSNFETQKSSGAPYR